MNDPEFIELRNKVFFGLLIVIVFSIPVFFLLRNKLFMPDSSLMKSLKNKNSMMILIVEDKCNRCNKSKEILNELDVNYFILNRSKERDYESIIRKLDIEKDIEVPTLIYVEKGKVYSYIYNIKNRKEITEFINNNIDGGN